MVAGCDPKKDSQGFVSVDKFPVTQGQCGLDAEVRVEMTKKADQRVDLILEAGQEASPAGLPSMVSGTAPTKVGTNGNISPGGH